MAYRFLGKIYENREDLEDAILESHPEELDYRWAEFDMEEFIDCNVDIIE